MPALRLLHEGDIVSQNTKAWAVALVVIGLVLAAEWAQVGSGDHVAVLRSQLHLPDDIEVRYHGNRSTKGMSESLQGLVRFTDEAYASYVARVDDPAVWTPTPFRFQGETIEGRYHPDALRWRTGSAGAFTGSAPLRWGWLHEPAVYEVAAPLTLCYAALKVSDGAPHPFEVLPCDAVPATDRPFVYVLARLDPASRTLFVHITQT